jgi:hypothetical protein
LFLHEFAVKYGLWVPYGEEPIKIDQTSLINSSCIIYNTGQEMMLKLVQYNRGR